MVGTARSAPLPTLRLLRLSGDIGCQLKLRRQFHVGGDRVGNESVFLYLGHDRSGGRDIGLASQDYNWLNADFNDPIFAVHIF
jgi:hypothetical protein